VIDEAQKGFRKRGHVRIVPALLISYLRSGGNLT